MQEKGGEIKVKVGAMIAGVELGLSAKASMRLTRVDEFERQNTEKRKHKFTRDPATSDKRLFKIKSNLLKLGSVGSGCPISRARGSCIKNVRAFRIELEFRSVGFWGEGKTGVPGEKPLSVAIKTNRKSPFNELQIPSHIEHTSTPNEPGKDKFIYD